MIENITVQTASDVFYADVHEKINASFLEKMEERGLCTINKSIFQGDKIECGFHIGI